MSKPEDNDPQDKGPQKADQAPSAGASGTEKRSGRVAFDARGNPTWEWQLETGVYSRDVSTQRLKKLDLGDLSIAETARHKKPEGLEESERGKKASLPGGGFNPYDNSSQQSQGTNPYDNARSLGKKTGLASSSPSSPPPRKPTDLKKLDAWMKLKKTLQGKKDED